MTCDVLNGDAPLLLCVRMMKPTGYMTRPWNGATEAAAVLRGFYKAFMGLFVFVGTDGKARDERDLAEV